MQTIPFFEQELKETPIQKLNLRSALVETKHVKRQSFIVI